MTLADLIAIFPYGRKRAPLFYVPLVDAMREFDINTVPRQASFIAQVGHESGQLRYVRELADGKAYEGRLDLGNYAEGDGPLYKGRGLLQITGRANYKECGAALGLDLIAHPELLELPVNACRSAAWFWKSRGLNKLADEGDQTKICRRINGGYNGLHDRMALYAVAIGVLA